MDQNSEREAAHYEASAVHAHLQWAIYALPPRHPARAVMMLATARADRQRNVLAQADAEAELMGGPETPTMRRTG